MHKIKQTLAIALLLQAALLGQMTRIGVTASASTMVGQKVPYPPFNTTVYRQLGCSVNWAQVNAAGAGQYNFTNLDACTNTAVSNGVTTVLFQLWQTPTWASSVPGDINCNASPRFNGSCDPPADLAADGTGTNASFKAYATALMQHALASWPGKNKRVYELWNEPSAGPQEWTGTNAQLVRMEQDAIAIRNAIDPDGMICSSSFSGLFRMSGENAYISFLQAGGGHGEVIGYHGYIQNGTGGNAPTDVLTVVLAFMRTQKAAFSLTGSLADTEYSWLVTSNFSGDQVAFVAQSLLVQQQPDLAFVNWYAYNYPDGILTTAVEGSVLNDAGKAFQQVVNFWLKPGTSMAAPCTASGTRWTCKTWSPAKNGPYLIVWDTGGTTTYTLPATYTKSYDALGAQTALPAGAKTVTIGARPIALEPGQAKRGWSPFRWFHLLSN